MDRAIASGSPHESAAVLITTSQTIPAAMTGRTAHFLDRLRARLAPAAILVNGAQCAARAGDATPVLGEPPAAVLRPATIAEVALILREASAHRQRLVVQGGRTGLSGGARVRAGEVALSLERLRMLSASDAVGRTITAGAGVTLAAVQQAAAGVGLRFGVDLGARGSATIGGMIATNAGGVRVLRHGMMRADVLGLEAVLADGTVLRRLSGPLKDNAGLDTGQLLVGSEGILGVVTAARLKLSAAPREQAAALLAVAGLEAAVALLTFLREQIDDLLARFELIFPEVYAGAVATAAVIPSFADWARAIRPEPWMGRTQRIEPEVDPFLAAVPAPETEPGIRCQSG